MDGSVSPVQISANIVLILGITSVITCEAETSSNLEKHK